MRLVTYVAIIWISLTLTAAFWGLVGWKAYELMANQTTILQNQQKIVNYLQRPAVSEAPPNAPAKPKANN